MSFHLLLAGNNTDANCGMIPYFVNKQVQLGEGKERGRKCEYGCCRLKKRVVKTGWADSGLLAQLIAKQVRLGGGRGESLKS